MTVLLASTPTWPFTILGSVVLLLVIVAGAFLIVDINRGAIGGRQTRERARRFLVVSTDDSTDAAGHRWFEDRRRDHPDAEATFMRLDPADYTGSSLAAQEAVDREAPDVVLVVEHGSGHPNPHEGLFGRLRDGLSVPVDAISTQERAS